MYFSKGMRLKQVTIFLLVRLTDINIVTWLYTKQSDFWQWNLAMFDLAKNQILNRIRSIVNKMYDWKIYTNTNCETHKNYKSNTSLNKKKMNFKKLKTNRDLVVQIKFYYTSNDPIFQITWITRKISVYGKSQHIFMVT